MRYLDFTVLFLLLICFSLSNGYIYEIKVLKKWDKETDNYCLIIGCSDFHDKMHPSNTAQRAYLTGLLSTCHSSMKVILEDLSSPNSSGSYGCKQFWLNSHRGILASLAKECSAQGLDVENIEYRYSRVIALGGLLTQLHESAYKSSPACAIRIGCLVDEVDQMIKKIETYCDNAGLNYWYKESCNRIKKNMRALHLESSKELSSAAYFEKEAPRNRLIFLKKLLTFDSNLLDCALVHSIINTSNKSVIVALAGGTHIDRAFEKLVTQGYTQIYATPVSFRHDYDIANALGSPILPGGYCIKPAAIDLHILEEYIK